MVSVSSLNIEKMCNLSWKCVLPLSGIAALKVRFYMGWEGLSNELRIFSLRYEYMFPCSRYPLGVWTLWAWNSCSLWSWGRYSILFKGRIAAVYYYQSHGRSRHLYNLQSRCPFNFPSYVLSLCQLFIRCRIMKMPCNAIMCILCKFCIYWSY